MIGMIIVLIFKRKIRCIDIIIRIIIYIIQISALALTVAYFLTTYIELNQFIRKLLGLYFPIFLTLFGFVFSQYQEISTLFFISVEITIIHTEIETTNIPFIIVLCSFFLVFNVLIYIKCFNNDESESLWIEENSVYRINLIIYWIFIQIYGLTMYEIAPSAIFHYLLIDFIPFFTCFSYSLFLPGIIYENKLYEIVRYKFSISLHILMSIVLTYIKNNLILSVISPDAASYFPLLFQIIFIYCYAKNKIHIKIKKLRIVGIECDIDGDTYEFSSIREEKAACLKRKGNQNDIIKNDIRLHGTIQH